MVRVIAILATAGIAALAGYASYVYLIGGRDSSLHSLEASEATKKSVVGQRRPDYSLGASDGSVVSASDFDGKVVLVNFWATWCGPCREEMPMLMDLRRQHLDDGLEVVGIALDDVQQARDFVAELGIEYPILVGSTDVMETMSLYGNNSGTLPYSTLLDQDGVIRWAKLGALDRQGLEGEIRELLDGN